MNKLSFAIVFGLSLIYSNSSTAQSFTNGDLNGSVGFVSVPTNWVQIPYTDPISQANSSPEATVDILDPTGPSSGGGVAGNPYSGNRFCSGLHAGNGGAFLWHEGIMQVVSGFTIGTTYAISLYQAVVKQTNCVDESGSWSIYLDGTFIQTTAVSTSTLAPDDINLIWDNRIVTFTATATSHNIKFIPTDDDANLLNSAAEPQGGLRMGIDLITFTVPPPLPVELVHFVGERSGKDVIINWKTVSEINNDYFLVERSADGKNWSAIGRVDGAGNSTTMLSYELIDRSPLSGTSYYRLKQFDFDGSASEPRVISVQDETKVEISLFPNPSTSFVNIESSEQFSKIRVIDSKGNSLGEYFYNNVMTAIIDLKDLKSGAYFLQITSNSGDQFKQLEIKK